MSPRKISADSDNWRPSYSDLTILPFEAHSGGPLRQRVSELEGTHPYPVGTTRYAHHWPLTSFV